MPKGLHVIGNVLQGAAQGMVTGQQLRNQTRAMDLREDAFRAEQEAYARQVAEAEHFAEAEAAQFAERARDYRASRGGGAEENGGVPPLLARPAEQGATSPAAAVGGAAGAAAFSSLNASLSGSSPVPAGVGQLAMEQAPSLEMGEAYIRRIEQTISRITNPEWRARYLDTQWGILEGRAFEKEWAQARTRFQRSVEMGDFDDITEPGSDAFATSPEFIQQGLGMLDQIRGLAGVSSRPQDVRAARGALLQFVNGQQQLRQDYAAKRAAVQQKRLERESKLQAVQALVSAGHSDLAGRLLAEIEQYDVDDLFGEDFDGSRAAAFAQTMVPPAGAQGAAEPGAESAGAEHAVVAEQRAQWEEMGEQERAGVLEELRSATLEAEGDPNKLRAVVEERGIPIYGIPRDALAMVHFEARGQKRKRDVTDPGPVRHGEMREAPKELPFGDNVLTAGAMEEEAYRLRGEAGKAYAQGDATLARKLLKEAEELERKANELGVQDE